MRFLLDQGLPRSAVAELAALGIQSEHVGNIGLAAATDDMILAEARLRGDVIVTMDADFHMLLALSGARTPSVIRIRIEGLQGAQIAQIIEQAVLAFGQDISGGAAVSVTPGLIRVRKLPIV
jgi:predicted nuclease of predicted toxin-antitoxin system